VLIRDMSRFYDGIKYQWRPRRELHVRAYNLSHVSDAALLHDLSALVAQDRITTASLLAHIAEVDARRLFQPAGYSSMFEYCTGVLHLSEDATSKRIQAARAAREFPTIFDAVAEGRLNLTGVVRLAPYLTPENAGELLLAAAHRSKSEIEKLLAERFSRPVAPRVQAAVVRIIPKPIQPENSRPVPEPVLFDGAKPPGEQEPANTPQADSPSPPHESPPPARFMVRVEIDESTHDKLRHAQALLSHVVPSGDVALVLERALDALIVLIEKRKFAATFRPRAAQHLTRGPRPMQQSSGRQRHVPAHVKRAVWMRDEGRCTFVAESGHRCEARWFLEFDHIDPVARGGEATADRMRLRCRAHNQYEAERTFGAEFMEGKRAESRSARAG
jgi:hypothetical protein